MMQWKKTKLGELSERITKGSTPTTYGYKFLDEGIPFVKVENIANGMIAMESITQYISEDAHEFQKRSQLQGGDVLFSIAGTIGRVALVTDKDVPANTNQAVAIIRGVTKYFIPEFLKMQLDSHVSLKVKSKARGGAMNNISLDDLKEMDVVVPPFNVQENIVRVVDTQLTRLDVAIKSLKSIKAKLELYRKSVLKLAFAGNLTNYSVSGVVRIGDIADLRSGTGFPEVHQNKHGLDYGFYKVGDISRAWLAKSNYLLEPEHEISKATLVQIKGKLIPEGSVVFAKIGEALKLNRRAITPCDCLVDNNVFALTPKKDLLNLMFLFYFMLTIELAKNSRATTVPSLRKEDVEGIKIPTFPAEEQKRVVEQIESLFSVISKVAEAINISLVRAEQLRNSILKSAFAGKLVN